MKRRMKSNKFSGAGSVLIGVLTALISYLAFILVFSVVLYFSEDPTKRVGLFSLIALALSGAVTGFLVTKKSEGKYTATLSAAILSLILIVTGAVISGGAPSIGTILTAVIYAASALLFSRLATPHGARSKFRR